MSETEIKQLTGVCVALTERNGWTEFEIDSGGEYKTKLSTKLQPLIEMGRAARQELAVWTFKESDGNENPNRPGTFYKNRYLEKVEVGGTADPASSAPSPTQSGPSHPPLIAGDKDRAITRMAVLKAATSTVAMMNVVDVPKDDVALEVMKVAQRFEAWVYRDIDDPPF